MTYLLDTCILSKLRKIKKHPDPILENWISKHREEQYYLSTLTIGEIQKGIYQSEDKFFKRVLEDWLWGEVVPRFAERILNIDNSVMAKWGELCGTHQQKGISLPSIDSLIASTAISKNLIVVTDNIKDFERIEGLRIYNPWEG